MTPTTRQTTDDDDDDDTAADTNDYMLYISTILRICAWKETSLT